MFRLGLGDHAMRNLRFWYSPLTETLASLRFLGEAAGLPGQRHWQRIARAELHGRPADAQLLCFLVPSTGAIPDFLDPPPIDGVNPNFADELDRMLEGAVGRAVDDLALVIAGNPAVGMPGRGVPTSVRTLLDRGEDVLLQATAAALHRHWQAAVRPVWRTLRDGLERDLDQRARRAVRHGSDEMLATLHHTVAFDGRSMLIDKPYQEDFPMVDALLLTPSVFGTARTGLTRHGARGLRLTYPAGDTARLWRPVERPVHALADLLGATRAALLADLTVPATTSALAQRHHLSPATVSHHLGVLLRSGLLSRHRQGRDVYYVRTSWASRLIRAQEG
ncbi:helix-turn-helix domain-containing protein [Micromonospora sp. NPDC023737]|uniref:ArsR/SmtB family transcription factor n=1 Tax=unclassified Micromonospora TaxID=2617518 RepID=UPI0033C70FB1